MKKKIIAIVVICVLLAAAVVCIILSRSNKEENTAETVQQEAVQTVPEAEEQVKESTPENTENKESTENVEKGEAAGTIMYIYSDSDSDKSGLQVMEKIKAEYEGKVAVNVMNINDEFVQMTGFALPDETPKLILITDSGAFSQLPNCADEQTIRAEIAKIIG